MKTLINLNLTSCDIELLKLIRNGHTLKQTAAALNITHVNVKNRIRILRLRHGFETTEELMYFLGRSEQLEEASKPYEFPIGI